MGNIEGTNNSINENGELLSLNKNTKKRIIYFDILNILACISVVFLHCNGIVHTYSVNTYWKTSLIFEVVCYWAVPVFLMLTGATLMNYREKYDTKTFLKKRLVKVVIPFIFWAAIMIIWKYMTGRLNINNWSITEIVNIIFANKEEETYFFMFLIIGVYLTLPMLSVLSDKKYRKILWYIVAIIFITKSILPVLCKSFGITYNSDLSILINGYLIFVILGHLLSTTELSKNKRYIIYLLGILSCILRYVVTYYLSTKNGAVDRILFSYTQFHSVFLAVAVFEFIKSIKWDKIIKNDKISNVLSQIASCSFGIYLIHKIVIYYLRPLLGLPNYSIIWRTVGAMLTYIVCLLIVYILKKIPILKKVVP